MRATSPSQPRSRRLIKSYWVAHMRSGSSCTGSTATFVEKVVVLPGDWIGTTTMPLGNPGGLCVGLVTPTLGAG